MRPLRRFIWLAAIMLMVPASSSAEWQFTPFAGVSFGGSTTFVDNDFQAGKVKFNFGGRAVWLGEVIGIEGDFGHTPGYFSGGDIVQSSHVTTFTGNVVVALPKRIAEYTLRPYVAGGGGLMQVATTDLALPISETLAAFDIAVGVTGFLSEHVGLNWDFRFFKARGEQGTGISLAPQQLSTWRATMGFAIRP